MSYDHRKIEKKWQKIWEETKIYQVDLKAAKKPYYNLMMFPYPSAEGLHVGNVYAFTGSDIRGRFKRMQGYNVFEPIGFDAFGIHSENFAIKKGIHPKILIKRNIAHFRQQLKNLGCIFDWKRVVDTTNPNYYKWTQWLFLQLFKAGLAYRKKAPVDWCPSCKTVLANEQVINGKCERCENEVIQKDTEQWFLKITNYTEKLLKNLDWIDWSEKTKFAQKNWIGKSKGTEIKFPISENMRSIQGSCQRQGSYSQFSIDVFTTRPDTLFGCAYLVVAPEHPIINNLKSQISNLKFVEKYIEDSKKKTERKRVSEVKEKTGVELKGIRAINPANNREISIWVADYVLYHYGTGAIMAVPAHDQRDLDFAKRYNLPVIEVIRPYFQKKELPKRTPLVAFDGRLEKAYEDEGYLLNSGRFDGMKSETARDRITEWLSKKERAKKAVCYKLRDWLISRQRYWGAPIPIIYCEKCGIQAVPEKDLPVLLPFVKNFRPKGTGVSPLASFGKFVKTKCPNCNSIARRETDVCDTFLDSSWYFLRYPSTDFDNKAFDEYLTKKWLPVDMYIGGQEHAVLHLMYSRFVTMALSSLKLIGFEEPFKKFRAHGLLTKNGVKMSKSKGNVVNPDEYYQKFGADTLRMYLMFLGPFEQGGDWQDLGILGIKRFLEKVWNLSAKIDKTNNKTTALAHQTIKKVTEDLENLKYNTAVSALMIFANKMAENSENRTFGNFKIFLLLLAPFAPHLSEELWSSFAKASEDKHFDVKNSIHNQSWLKYDSKLIKEEKTFLVIQINGKVRDKIEVEADISEKKAKELALSQEKIKKWIMGKEIKKVIFIPGKLINLVV